MACIVNTPNKQLAKLLACNLIISQQDLRSYLSTIISLRIFERLQMSLKLVLIHDEANSSVEGETEIHRQLEITESEYNRKIEIFRKLVKIGKTSGGFCKVIEIPAKETKYEATFFTTDGAALTVALQTYPGGKCFLGTRGSPTKLLTGQNLVDVKDIARIDAFAKKLKCGRFEARSIIGFLMIKNTVKATLGETLFTSEESSMLRNLDVSVYSVGYATYLDFGHNRDEKFHLLTYLATARVNVAGDTFPIADFLGVGSTEWRCDTEQGLPESPGVGWRGRLTGLLLKKKVNNVIAYQQMLYLKEEEVESKANTSGRRNKEEMSALSAVDRNELKNNLVRLDNIFFREYLKMWLTAFGISYDSRRITIRDIAPLFEDPSLIRKMTQCMSNELGLRTLLLAPTMEKIEALVIHERSPLEDAQKVTLEHWMKNSDASVETSPKGSKRIVWDLGLDTDDHRNRPLLKTLVNDHYLDLRLPVTFYGLLNEVRGEFYLTMRDRTALAHDRIGYTGLASLALEAPAVKEKMRENIRVSIVELKKSLDLPGPESKKSIARWYKAKKESKNGK